MGFKLKLNFGSATSNFIHSSEPGGAPYQNIQEAYVSYLAPAGKGILLLERALRVGDHLLERLGAGRTLSSPNT